MYRGKLQDHVRSLATPKQRQRDEFNKYKTLKFEEDLFSAVFKNLGMGTHGKVVALRGLQPFAGTDSGRIAIRLEAECAKKGRSGSLEMHYSAGRGELEKIPVPEGRKIPCEGTKLPSDAKDFDLIFVREGISRLPQDMQAETLAQMRLLLRRGGKLLLADIHSINGAVQEALNFIISAVLVNSGRGAAGAHIPTEDEFRINIKDNAGFADFRVAGRLAHEVTADFWMPQYAGDTETARAAVNMAILRASAKNREFSMVCQLGGNENNASFWLPAIVICANRKA
jgi:hypothetical protein